MRTLSIITIALLASLALAQDCNNPLLNFFGLQDIGTPQSGAGLPYCSNLQNGETCCSADTVSAFQTRLDDIVYRLNNYFAARDLYLAQLRNSYLDRFNDFLEDINDNHTEDLYAIRIADPDIAGQLQTDIETSTQLSYDARQINNQFVDAMKDYQEARTNCFNTALQVQASAWCLACDPNYADQGVNDDGTVTFSDGLCEAVSDACWPFFSQSARFNPLIRAREAYWRLAAVSSYLNTFSDTNLVVPFIVLDDPYNPLPTQLAVDVPEEWVAGAEELAVAGQCTDLWQGNDNLAQLLLIGAPISLPEDNENIEGQIVAEENVEAQVEVEVEVEVDVDVEVDDNDNDNGNGNENENDDEFQVIIVDDGNVDDVATVSTTRLLQGFLAGDNGVWAPDYTATGLNFDNLRFDPGDFFGVGDRTNEDVTDQTDDDNDGDAVVVTTGDVVVDDP